MEAHFDPEAAFAFRCHCTACHAIVALLFAVMRKLYACRRCRRSVPLRSRGRCLFPAATLHVDCGQQAGFYVQPASTLGAAERQRCCFNALLSVSPSGRCQSPFWPPWIEIQLGLGVARTPNGGQGRQFQAAADA